MTTCVGLAKTVDKHCNTVHAYKHCNTVYDRINTATPYMTIYMVISLPKIPYTHCIIMVLANPNLCVSWHARQPHRAHMITCDI